MSLILRFLHKLRLDDILSFPVRDYFLSLINFSRFLHRLRQIHNLSRSLSVRQGTSFTLSSKPLLRSMMHVLN